MEGRYVPLFFLGCIFWKDEKSLFSTSDFDGSEAEIYNLLR